MNNGFLSKFLIIIYAFLFFPLTAISANISLPYYNGFEKTPADQKFDEGNTNGLDVNNDHSLGCSSYIRNNFPARYGDNYLALECKYTDSAHRNDAYRIDISLEGLRNDTPSYRLRKNDGTEYWIGWSSYIPPNYVAEKFQHMNVEIMSDAGWTKVWTLRYGGGATNGNYSWSGEHQWEGGSAWPKYDSDWRDDKGKWSDWVLHAVFYDKDNANAKFVVYKDGVPVYKRNGAANITTGGNLIFMINCYNYFYHSSYTPIEKWILQHDRPHIRGTYFDEIRFYEGKIAENSYCDACPPILPAKPNITYPINGKTDVPTQFTVSYSSYSDSITDPKSCFAYFKSQIQIDEYGGDWSSTVYDSGEITSEKSFNIFGLSPSRKYQIRIRHKSKRKGSTVSYWSNWSDNITFTTSYILSKSKLSPPRGMNAKVF